MSGFTPVRDKPMFELDNDQLIPTELSGGPWHPGSLHGSAMLGIMARAAEQYPSDRPRQVARLTVDMMKAAPRAPLRIDTEVIRSGKNIEWLQLRLKAEGETFVQASAMRIREAEVEVGQPYQAQGESPAAPEAPIEDFFHWPGAETPAYHHTLDIGFSWFQQLPVMWFRSCVPLVAGEPLTPLQRTAMAGDWTYAVPNIALRIREGKSSEDFGFFAINPDTTLNISRPMRGDWLGILARVDYDHCGMGAVSGQLFDHQGAMGFSSQSVLIRGPEAAPMHVKRQQDQS